MEAYKRYQHIKMSINKLLFQCAYLLAGVRQKYNCHGVLIPDHSPEILHGRHHGVLSYNELSPLVVALGSKQQLYKTLLTGGVSKSVSATFARVLGPKYFYNF